VQVKRANQYDYSIIRQNDDEYHLFFKTSHWAIRHWALCVLLMSARACVGAIINFQRRTLPGPHGALPVVFD
jgi:hypothetical protein